MLINKSNYELFALDYIEGNLDARALKAMKAFLQAHPDIESEIESMQAAMFTFEADESIVYDNKSSLLKEENETAIVFMRQRRWYRMAAAAAVAILLIGFGVGYFAGSVSSPENGIAAETTPSVEEVIDPVTPVTLEEETTAEIVVVEEIENKPSNDVIPKNQDKQVEKPLRLEKQFLPALANLEPKDVESKEKANMVIETAIEDINSISLSERTETIAATPLLPKVEVNITIQSVESLPKTTIKKVDTPQNYEVGDLIASLTNNDRLNNRFSKIKNFLGKLPFEDATLDAFVPSYFANADTNTDTE
ncbi:MAG: hypothetical protein AAFO82_00300 [Bacteroidota bacterium]